MPGMNRAGPVGLGPMTGRKAGWCAGKRVAASGCGRGLGLGRGMRNDYGAGFGYGRGFGPGRGAGPGRELGWFSVGYDGVGYDDATNAGIKSAPQSIKEALEIRANLLRAELARTEALLTPPASGATNADATDSTRESGK